jgi:Methyl-CpG binding domain
MPSKTRVRCSGPSEGCPHQIKCSTPTTAKALSGGVLFMFCAHSHKGRADTALHGAERSWRRSVAAQVLLPRTRAHSLLASRHWHHAGGTWDEAWQAVGSLRKGGATTGRLDIFFISPPPQSQRLRSIKEALEYLKLVEPQTTSLRAAGHAAGAGDANGDLRSRAVRVAAEVVMSGASDSQLLTAWGSGAGSALQPTFLSLGDL